MLAPDTRQVAIWNKWLIALRKTLGEATEFTDVGPTDFFRLDDRLGASHHAVHRQAMIIQQALVALLLIALPPSYDR